MMVTTMRISRVPGGGLVACVCLYAAAPTDAQTPDRRLLVEVNLAPALLAVAAGSLADETVDELVVDKWLPGLALAYRVHDRLTLGYSYHPGFDLILTESWGFTGAGDLDIDLPHQTGDIHGLDVRLLPFGGGFQISASYLRVMSSSYQMDAVRKGATMALGSGAYATDAVAEWVSVADNRVGVGIGYSWSVGKGLTLSAGLGVPIPFGDGDIRDATITPTDPGVTFAAADLQNGISALDSETFFAPVVVRLGVGWAFRAGR